jgi:hypothetical protein
VFRGFSRKNFPCKNLCSCSSFDLLLLRYFVTSSIRAEGLRSIHCPKDFPLRSRAATRSVFFMDQQPESCGVMKIHPDQGYSCGLLLGDGARKEAAGVKQ